MDEASWKIVNSLERLVFGIIELYTFIWLFNKKNWHEVIFIKGLGKGMLAGIIIILLTVAYILDLAFGAVYIYSRNILAAIVLHAVYDIPANFIGYATNFTTHPVRKFLDTYFYPYKTLVLLIVAVICIVIAKPWFNQEIHYKQMIREGGVD